jgi:amidase
MSGSEICFMTATELAQLIHRKELSALEVMEAHLRQIERVNPKVNAIVTYLPERGIDGAKALDKAMARGEDTGPLAGLPVAHKDLENTAGIRTTYGSPLYRDFVPAEDSLLVARLREAGAICIGKTNTPEFGAGSHTFNEVFGATRNPYDPTRTAGGSSGGAAVALACGMLPVADGSDAGGSLRNPAAFNNIVGFRSSPGRVPNHPSQLGWYGYGIYGPMARTVADVALLLSAISAPDPRDPFSRSTPFTLPETLERAFKGVRVALSPDFGGQLVFEPEIPEQVAAQQKVFEDLGYTVEQAVPDFEDADEVFKSFRLWSREATLGMFYDRSPELLKDTLRWEMEKARQLTAPEMSRLALKREELFKRMVAFMQQYDFLVLPVTQVSPFDINQPWVTEINGVKQETYLDWMRSCYYISATGHPAISVPCGFTSAGLPVGLQIVGRYNDELSVLQIAHAFEQATGYGKQRPALALE